MSRLQTCSYEHLDQDVAGDVGREDRARRAGGAERALRELAVVAAGEDRAPVLELDDVARRLAREELDRVLVAEVVGALDRVVGVDLGAVLGRVAERRVDAALGGAGVASASGGASRSSRRRRPRRVPRSRRACLRSRRPTTSTSCFAITTSDATQALSRGRGPDEIGSRGGEPLEVLAEHRASSCAFTS